jgi:SAM-dependent methyltransferase
MNLYFYWKKMNEIADIYDHLLQFESRNKKNEPYPIHKKLHFSERDQNILDWLILHLSFSKEDYVLDAGCGTGFSLFYLHELFGLKGCGISISPSEINYANQVCNQKKLENHLDFILMDYQLHQGGPYTKILAIESLKHARELRRSIHNLLEKLTDKGTMIIIDDFVVGDYSKIDLQKKLWSSPGFRRFDEYKNIIQSAGSFTFHIKDLTSIVYSRPLWILNFLYIIGNVLNYFTPSGFRRNLNTYLGGLLLEKLYAKRQVNYLAIIIEK